ncbi:hypothetical protein BDP27DRAFT_1376253 [Rhodocollybia butyracea]|uniref:Uncharacterized protein n=1 Tax=Rhodocollybia butyracea TaxID=206335 RepID=A0A9P5P0N8_9AGAR|nr:hypothetical protein BDP27DRAFT_1376253 [Rhodocollybia butyracea]
MDKHYGANKAIQSKATHKHAEEILSTIRTSREKDRPFHTQTRQLTKVEQKNQTHIERALNIQQSGALQNMVDVKKYSEPDCWRLEETIIDEAIDSNNFMRDVKASGVGYVHGDKNVVNFGVEVNGKEKKKTESIGPHQLHIGDVVDIAFAVIEIEGRGASNPTNGVAKLLLRSVTLLEGKHTQAWIKTKALLGSSGGRKVNQLRKRAAFDEEEVEVTRKRLKQMSLDVNEEGSSGSA